MVTLIRDEEDFTVYAQGLLAHNRSFRWRPSRYPCLVGTVVVGTCAENRFIYPDDAALLLEAYEASK